MSVFALGLNHTTAPLDLRGRFAFTLEQLAPTLQAFRERAWTARQRGRASSRPATAPSSTVARRAGRWWRPRGRLAGRRRRRRQPALLRTTPTCCEDGAGRAPRLPRRQRPRFDGAGRAADPRPDEAGGARGRHAPARSGTHAAPDVPALVRGRQGSAQLDRDRRALDQHGGGGGAPGRRSCSRTCARRKVLFVGAGEMIELAATHFAATHAARAWPSPTARCERGEKLAGRFGAEAMRLADLPGRLAEFDIVDLAAPPARCPSSAWARSSAR